MATLAALLADVYSLTNRPDLVAESTVAVKAATLKAHQRTFYERDIVTSSFNFANPALFVQSFNVAGLSRWRSWAYLQNFNPLIAPIPPVGGVPFDIIASNNLFDDYQTLKSDIAYQVGVTLNLRCSVALAILWYGFYQNIDLTNVADMGWISDSHPYAIVFEAARNVFKTIGYDEQAAYYKDLCEEQYHLVDISNVTVVGG